MVYEWVVDAAEARRCGFKLSAGLQVSESVVKDRERCCLLIASIVRREGEIICKDGGQGTGNREQKEPGRGEGGFQVSKTVLGAQASGDLSEYYGLLATTDARIDTKFWQPFTAKSFS